MTLAQQVGCWIDGSAGWVLDGGVSGRLEGAGEGAGDGSEGAGALILLLLPSLLPPCLLCLRYEWACVGHIVIEVEGIIKEHLIEIH